MSKKKTVLLAAMGVALLGVAGSALALTYKSATQTKTGALDSAIYLYWGSGSTNATVSDVESLKAGTNQYRSLTVAPKSSKSVAGTVTVTYTFDVGDSIEENGVSKTSSLKGLTFNVYETASEVTSPSSSDCAGTPATTLTIEDDNDHTATTIFTISSGDAAHETAKYYVLEFSYSGVQMTDGHAFGGGVIISQSFAVGS